MKYALLLLLFILQSCSRFYYFPDKREYGTPKLFDIPYKSVYFESKDKTKLHGWIMKSKLKKNKGLVVQFHGNAQNLSSHFASLAWLTHNGYDVFVFDYRGYGKSQGRPSPEGLYFDATSALDYAVKLKRNYKYSKLVVYAQSLGGNVALDAIEDFNSVNEIDNLIIDSSFYSYRSVAFSKCMEHVLTWLIAPVAYLVVDNSYAPDSMPKIKTLIIHGESDQIVAHKFGKDLFQRANMPKEFWSIPKSNHLMVYMMDNGKYRDQLVRYLDR